MSSMAYEASPETVRGAEEDLTAEALAALDRRAASIAGNMHLAVLRYRDLHVGNAETRVAVRCRVLPQRRWRRCRSPSPVKRRSG